MIKEYKAKYLDLVFDLKFKDNLTLICGESGIGKTLMVKALKSTSINKQDNINFIDASTSPQIFDFILNKSQNAITVIDNADVLLNEEQKFDIVTDRNNNQFILIVHDTSGYAATEKNIAYLTINNKIGKLRYLGDKNDSYMA